MHPRRLLALLIATLTLIAVPSSSQAQAGRWGTTALSTGRTDLVAASVGTRMLFIGGCWVACEHPRALQVSTVTDVYESVSGQRTAATLSEARARSALASVGEKVLIAGGSRSYQGPVTAAVDLYDAATGQWSTATLSEPRAGITAAIVSTKAIFAGGYTYEGSSTKPLTAIDIFDSATGQWSTASLSRRGAEPSVATIGGKALFVVLGAVDLYDDAAGQWSTASLSVDRISVAVATVGTRALFAGGFTCPGLSTPPYRCQGDYSAVVDIFDAATGQWSTATLSKPRRQIRAVTVGSYVLFAGGELERSQPTATVDVYDSTTGTWATGSLSRPRYNPTVAVAGAQALFVAGQTLDVFDAATGQWSTTQRSGTSPS